METIDKVKMLHLWPVDAVQQMENILDNKTANEFIICTLMSMIKSDIDVLSFCDCIDRLVDSTDSKQFFATFRDGRYYMSVCIHCSLIKYNQST